MLTAEHATPVVGRLHRHENFADLGSLVSIVCTLLAIGHPGVGFVSVGLADSIAAASAGNHRGRGVRLAERAPVPARATDSRLCQASGLIPRWPNTYFARLGFFSLERAHSLVLQSQRAAIILETRMAGKLPSGFGGRVVRKGHPLSAAKLLGMLDTPIIGIIDSGRPQLEVVPGHALSEMRLSG